MTVYRNGEAVGTSRISSGKSGYDTPQGIFSIIQKRRHHYSNIYRGASMPFMQRLTWSGIAMHQGVVPGYPASHGCIRLPSSFARSLFKYTERRTHVVVTSSNPVPQSFSHPNLFQPTQIKLVEPAQNASGARNVSSQRYAFNTVGDNVTVTDAGTPAGQKTVLNDAPRTTGNPFLDIDNAAMDAHRQLMRATKSASP